MSLENLRKAIKDGKLVIGSEKTEKLLKKGGAKEVFVASNCDEDLKERLKTYAEISDCKFNVLKENANDIGAICKKPFSISVCCY
jgi:large subunit ribosomal protein L30e